MCHKTGHSWLQLARQLISTRILHGQSRIICDTGNGLELFLQVKDFKPLSRVFLQLLGQTSAYRVAQTHGAHGEATALCGSNERVEALRTCRYAPFATLSDGNVGT